MKNDASNRILFAYARFGVFVVLLLMSFAFASSSTSLPIAVSHVQPVLLDEALQNLGGRIRVIVQKSTKDNRVENLVTRLGGVVTQDLSIINGFAANVPATAMAELAKADGVRWVSLDAPVKESQTASTNLFTTWAMMSGTSVPNTFANAPAIYDSALGPNGTFGVGTDNTKGAFAGFDYEITPGHAITKVEVLLPAYAPYMHHDFKVKIWLGGRQIKEFPIKWELFTNYNSAMASGLVAVNITSARTWTWADLDNQLELYLDLGGFDGKDSLYLDAIGLRVTSAPGLDPSGGVAPTSLPKAVIDTSKLSNVFNRVVRAMDVWNESPGYLQGQGLTVAVVDSGLIKNKDIGGRVLAKPNFNDAYHDSNDKYGHGTFVSAIVAGDGKGSDGRYMGIAPKTNLINVRVSDDQGAARESDVVAGLQWILNNRAKYNIRVVNLSLNSTVAQSYHTSPLDAACEVLWFNKVVVVVSAGNNGNATIFPPANDPFVITVGATDDKGTPSLTDDLVASFSAAGMTIDGIAKPDLVAPGTRIIALLSENNKLTMGINHPANAIDKQYFRMSGTSVAAPIVSGAVALLLQDEPGLTPDQVKYRLKATANKNWAGYIAAKAGAGYLDIYAAVKGVTTQSANTGTPASRLLGTGSDPINWNSVDWNSVDWNSVDWNSVDWNSVDWNSVDWNSDYWGP